MNKPLEQRRESADARAPQELSAGAERDRVAAIVRLDADERMHGDHERPTSQTPSMQ